MVTNAERLRHAIDIAESHAEEAMQTLVKLMRCGDPAIMRQAAMCVLAYSHGRPEKIIRIERAERIVKPIELILSPADAQINTIEPTKEETQETIPDTELQ